MSNKYQFKPLISARWDDLEELFGRRGACGGCWCMYWRQSQKEFEAKKGAGNRRALRGLLRSGGQPGILAYHDGQPVGWCSFGRREEFSRLQRSRVLAPIDDTPVWSIVCFFIARPFRRLGLGTRLLEAALRYVARQGGNVIEGYPIDPRRGKMPDVFAWTGLSEMFLRAGFEECARRSATRPIMRKRL